MSTPFTIDLTGSKGLAPKFYGDIYRTTGSPHLRYKASDGQMVSGYYNPFKRDGYLSPANGATEPVTSNVPTGFSTTIGSSQDYQYIGVSLSPSVASVNPAVLGTPSSGTAASGTTLTISHTVNSTSANTVLTVIAMNATGIGPTSATFNGTAMSVITTGVNNFYYTVFQLANPTATTANVVITWSVSSGHLAAGCVTVNGTSGISSVYATNSATSATATLNVSSTSSYDLILASVMSGAATHTQASTQTEIFNFLTTGSSFRFSESRRNALIRTAYTGCIYDNINADHYWCEAGGATTNSSQIMKGDTLDDRSLESVLSLYNCAFTDMEIYQVNGVRKLFYVYRNASGNMEVGIASLPFSSNNNTWLTGTVTGAFTNATTTNPFIRRSDNGFAYLFQDYMVHKINGTSSGGSNGTVTANALVFPPYFQLVDAVDYKGRMNIAVMQRTTNLYSATEEANFQTECGVYIWDRLTTVASTKDYIPVTGVKEIRRIYIAPGGQLRIICLMNNRFVQIREYNGTTFKPIQELPLNSYPFYVDSLDIVGENTMWCGQDGNLYIHGGENGNSVFMLLNIGSTSLLLSGGGNTYGDGVSGNRGDPESFYFGYNGGMVKYFPHAESTINSIVQSTAQGDVFTPVKFLPHLSNVKLIRIHGAPCVSTGSTTIATIKVYVNQSSSASYTFTVTRTLWNKGYIEIPINKPYVNAIQLEIEFNTSQTLGSNDFTPSYAEVIIDTTKTIR